MRSNNSGTSHRMGIPRYSIAVCLVLLAWSTPAAAQRHPDETPYLEATQKKFDYGILQYDLSAWATAAGIFEEIIRQHPVNHRTTAAYVMAARARHLEGKASQSLRLIEELLREFPSCTYEAEACLIAGDAAIDAGSRLTALRWYLRAWSGHGGDRTVLASRISALRPEEFSDGDWRRIRTLLPGKVDSVLARLLSLPTVQPQPSASASSISTQVDNKDNAVRIIAALPMHESDPRRASIVRDLRDGMMAALDVRRATDARDHAHTRDHADAANVVFEVVDSGDADTLARIVARLDRDARAMVLIGGAFSEDAESVSRHAADRGMLVLLPTATAEGLTRYGSNIFQLNTPMTQRARLLADFAWLDLDVKNVAIIAPSRSFPRAMAEAFAARCTQLGINVVHTGWFACKEEAIAICRGIAAIGVKNGILFAPVRDRDDIAAVLEGMSVAQLPLPVVGGGNWDHPDLLVRHGNAHTIFFEADVAPDTSATRYRRLARTFATRTSRTVTREALFGADAMEIALTVTTGTAVSREQVRARIANVFEGIRAPVNFLEGRVNASMNIVEYHHGILRKHEAFHSK